MERFRRWLPLLASSLAVTYGSAINDRGDVAGNSGGLPTFFAASGGATPINTPGLYYNRIYGLNNAGTVLVNGYSQDDATGNVETFQLWNTGHPKPSVPVSALPVHSSARSQ